MSHPYEIVQEISQSTGKKARRLDAAIGKLEDLHRTGGIKHESSVQGQILIARAIQLLVSCIQERTALDIARLATNSLDLTENP